MIDDSRMTCPTQDEFESYVNLLPRISPLRYDAATYIEVSGSGPQMGRGRRWRILSKC